jgi:hypothetical protein
MRAFIAFLLTHAERGRAILGPVELKEAAKARSDIKSSVRRSKNRGPYLVMMCRRASGAILKGLLNSVPAARQQLRGYSQRRHDHNQDVKQAAYRKALSAFAITTISMAS